MGKFLKFLLDWSEVWAPLIPLVFLLFKKNQPRFLKPVILYLVAAFLLNAVSDIISDYKAYLPGCPC